MKSRKIVTKSFSGTVVHYARKLKWDKVYELIHNFQVIRDLQQFSDMDHIDINSCGIRHY